MKNYFVYILAEAKRGTLYTGVTSDIKKRVYEHKNAVVEGFTKKYNIKILVYYELHNSIEEAIKREKRLKRWNRHWKYELIEKDNPDWEDLYDKI